VGPVLTRAKRIFGGKQATQGTRSSFQVEALEQRLLLSAEVVPSDPGILSAGEHAWLHTTVSEHEPSNPIVVSQDGWGGEPAEAMPASEVSPLARPESRTRSDIQAAVSSNDGSAETAYSDPNADSLIEQLTETLRLPNGPPATDDSQELHVGATASGRAGEGVSTSDRQALTAANITFETEFPNKLTRADSGPVLDQALLLWRSSGLLSDDAIAQLDSIVLELTELRAGIVGETDGLTIYLDETAAGRGWFVDPTPADSSEFGIIAGRDHYLADAASEAFGKMDLLTALLHEVGHIAGFDHDSGLEVMGGTLSTGERVTLGNSGSRGSGPVSSALTSAGGVLTAEPDDTNPITFRIVDNNTNGIPDVEVTGSNGDDATFDDITAITGSDADDILQVDIDADTVWSLTGLNSGNVAISGFTAITFSDIENLTGAPPPRTPSSSPNWQR
jgi:hypothetical protein